MNETQANLLMMDGKAVEAAFYPGVVGLGDPEDCPIARFYHAEPFNKEPDCTLQGGPWDDAAVYLHTQALIALYDALTPRIAYLRECAKKEAGE